MTGRRRSGVAPVPHAAAGWTASLLRMPWDPAPMPGPWVAHITAPACLAMRPVKIVFTAAMAWVICIPTVACGCRLQSCGPSQWLVRCRMSCVRACVETAWRAHRVAAAAPIERWGALHPREACGAPLWALSERECSASPALQAPCKRLLAVGWWQCAQHLAPVPRCPAGSGAAASLCFVSFVLWGLGGAMAPAGMLGKLGLGRRHV